jgi:hypothetical protein
MSDKIRAVESEDPSFTTMTCRGGRDWRRTLSVVSEIVSSEFLAVATATQSDAID